MNNVFNIIYCIFWLKINLKTLYLNSKMYDAEYDGKIEGFAINNSKLNID